MSPTPAHSAHLGRHAAPPASARQIRLGTSVPSGPPTTAALVPQPPVPQLNIAADRQAVPSLCLGSLARRDLGPQANGQREAGKQAESPVSSNASSRSSSSGSSDSSAPAGGTPAARLRAEEAASKQRCKIGLKLDLSRVLPVAAGSARRPLFQEQQGPVPTPCTPRGREPVRRQDLERLEAVSEGGIATASLASPPLATPRCATVLPVPLTARGPKAPTFGAPPLSVRGVPAEFALPPRPASQPSSARWQVGGCPREYILEVLSPTHARELVANASCQQGGAPPPPWAPETGNGPRAAETCSPTSPGSPPLMLRPSEAAYMEALPGEDARSPGSISASSSEGEIRDRLRLGLLDELRPSCPKAPGTAYFEELKLDIPQTAMPNLNLAHHIPTPVRSRLSAASPSKLPDACESSDAESSDEGDWAPRATGEQFSLLPLCELPDAAASTWMPPPTPRCR